MHERLAQFERELRRGNDKSCHLVRNRHILLSTFANLPASEAREGIARDPGLCVFGVSEKDDIILIRWDAGCSYCGSAFEIDANGKPMKAPDVNDTQISLFSATDPPFWEILEGGPKGCEPEGRVRCPVCGRPSKLGSYAMELAVTLDWPIISTSALTPPFGRGGEILDISHRIRPGCLGANLNLIDGSIQHGWANASRTELDPDAAERLDEYPLAEAVATLLHKNGIEITGIQRGCPLPINELLRVLRNA